MMPKKTRSEICLTSPVRTAEGDEVIDIGRDPNWPRELPAQLREPVVVDVEACAEKIMGTPDKFSRMQAETNFNAKLRAELHERWHLALRTFGEVDAKEEYWKYLALTMLREFVPGLRVKYVFPARTPARVMTDEHVYAVVDHVDEVTAALQAKRSSKSPKVLQRTALRHAYNHWPKHLGRKRPTLESWETHYHQCKQQYWRLNMSLVELSSLLQAPNSPEM
jgi:hypothetical protein